MWNYYICKRQTHLIKHASASEEFPGGRIRESHCLHLDDSDDPEVIACVRFHRVEDQDAFESEAGVTSFPHVYDFSTKIGADLAAKLAPFGITEAHTTSQAMSVLGKLFPPLDPRFKNYPRA